MRAKVTTHRRQVHVAMWQQRPSTFFILISLYFWHTK